MATAPNYSPNVDQFGAPVEPKKSSGCLKGCLIVAVVLFVLAAILGIVIWKNWRPWAASFASEMTSQMIDQSAYPPQEKAEIKAEVARVFDAFREGTLTQPQVVALMEQLKDAPMTAVFIASGIEQKRLSTSALTDDEKSTGRQSLKRFERGAVDGTIPKAAIDSVMVHVADRQPNGPWVPHEPITDEQLKAFLDSAKTEADKANIPAEPAEIDPSDEVKKIIDAAMQAR